MIDRGLRLVMRWARTRMLQVSWRDSRNGPNHPEVSVSLPSFFYAPANSSQINGSAPVESLSSAPAWGRKAQHVNNISKPHTVRPRGGRCWLAAALGRCPPPAWPIVAALTYRRKARSGEQPAGALDPADTAAQKRGKGRINTGRSYIQPANQ